jgi:hypothetical protein
MVVLQQPVAALCGDARPTVGCQCMYVYVDDIASYLLYVLNLSVCVVLALPLTHWSLYDKHYQPSNKADDR